MTAFSPWGGNLGGGMLAPFFDPLLSSTMNELQRVQQRALQSLPPQLRLDVFETDKELKVRADLPGVCDKDVQIHIDENNMLSVQAEKSDNLEQDETRGLYNFHRSERSSGRQWRQIRLPQYVDGSKMTAKLESGVLTISAPKIEGHVGGRRKITVS
jgi:HSP20 family protein